ncbi:hypothetical protein NUW54_g6071 [Trametes sanguinea]|uniref:Uncharacterized protein n=1 Tax=Trametes sanguinea TaxID=158606 RepID=A0ACC1PUH4_9APHY|nr:hypothetical protein NUW54_g6071 [Trametes sanguinea]
MEHVCSCPDPTSCACVYTQTWGTHTGRTGHAVSSAPSYHSHAHSRPSTRDADGGSPYPCPLPQSSTTTAPAHPHAIAQPQFWHPSTGQPHQPSFVTAPGLSTSLPHMSLPAATVTAEIAASQPAPAIPVAAATLPAASPRIPLGDTAREVTNTKGRGRKRGVPSGTSSQRSKRKKTQHGNSPPIDVAEAAPPQTITGPPLHADIGPEPQDPAPLRRFQSLLSRHDTTTDASASDVWYFVYGIRERQEPENRPVDQPHSREKPDAPFLACRLCTRWQTWKCSHGQTKGIRRHMRKYHYEQWTKTIVSERLKGWESVVQQHPAEAGPRTMRRMEPFTLKGFIDRLSGCIADNSLPIKIVDSDTFRDLIIYTSTAPEPLDDDDIPHRTQTHKILIERYADEIKKLRADLQLSIHEMQAALGRISFTCDMWSCRVLKGFMAVTLHYCAKDRHNHLVLRTRLGAFRHVPGRHTGENLARQFVGILEELGILGKIGVITMDNGSNCGTMLEDLERVLLEKGIPFDRKGNRIRCFPHVVNISVQRGLRALGCTSKKSSGTEPTQNLDTEQDARQTIEHQEETSAEPGDPVFDEEDLAADPDFNDALQEDPEYAAALAANPVKAARDLINKARQSGQRREDFERIVGECIKNRTFGDEEPNGTQLLRDVDTRWSSTFLMIDRLLSLYPAVQLLMRKHDIGALLSDKTLDVLQDIREFLAIPHAVQELLSAENTPTVSHVLPAYTELLEILRGAKSALPRISHGIQAAITALEEYMAYTRQTRVYALAMMVNPTIKFSWISKHWKPHAVETAREWLTSD